MTQEIEMVGDYEIHPCNNGWWAVVLGGRVLSEHDTRDSAYRAAAAMYEKHLRKGKTQ